MTWGKPLGLDELMIINPGPSNGDAYLLGEDGTLYQVQGLGEIGELPQDQQYLLGEDGTLYQVQGIGLGGRPYPLSGRHSCQCRNRSASTEGSY